MRNIAIVGAGRVGNVLGRILIANGAHISAVVSRSEESARAGGRFLRCRTWSTTPDAIPRDTHLVFLTVPHAAVASVADALSRVGHLRFRHLAVCHASGMLTADVLTPLRTAGAATFSFHPLQTFPRDFPPAKIVPSARGIWYGVDGDDRGIRKARTLARLLGGRIVTVPPHLRAFYHASCVLASNHLTTLLSLLERMHARLGTTVPFQELYGPIIHATLANCERTSPAVALSGPVARGGTRTVGDHFDALAVYLPDLLPYFAAMTRESIRLAATKGTLDRDRIDALDALVRKYDTTVQSPSSTTP